MTNKKPDPQPIFDDDWFTEEEQWQRDSFTAAELQTATFPELRWIVPNIIPAEGLALLCSKPKFGKSWFAYDLCIACTANRFTLGDIKPLQGDVLYLALEDSKRRLQRRMTKLLPSFTGMWPDGLRIKIKWRRLHEGGLDDIRAWHQSAKAEDVTPIMVVIDVLAKVRKPTGNKPAYESDYEALSGLHALALELNIAAVVLHHTRKMAADDLMEMVSGTFGQTGAADTVIVLASKGGGAVMDIRGRDVESNELAIAFGKKTCRWTILGNAAEVHQSDQRKRIIAVLVERGEPMRVAEIALAAGMGRNAADLLLGRMLNDKDGPLIKRVKHGLYAHKDWFPPTDPRYGKPKRRRRAAKSVASIKPRQIPDAPQDTKNTRENGPTCQSVASVTVLPNNTVAGPLATAEPVKTATDAKDRQISSQATERSDLSDLKNLSPPATDFDRSTDLGDGEVCAYCGRPGDLHDCAYGDIAIRLHRRCQYPWVEAYEAATVPAPCATNDTAANVRISICTTRDGRPSITGESSL